MVRRVRRDPARAVRAGSGCPRWPTGRAPACRGVAAGLGADPVHRPGAVGDPGRQGARPAGPARRCSVSRSVAGCCGCTGWRCCPSRSGWCPRPAGGRRPGRRGGDPVTAMARAAAGSPPGAGMPTGVAPCLVTAGSARDSVGLDAAARAANLADRVRWLPGGAPPAGATGAASSTTCSPPARPPPPPAGCCGPPGSTSPACWCWPPCPGWIGHALSAGSTPTAATQWRHRGQRCSRQVADASAATRYHRRVTAGQSGRLTRPDHSGRCSCADSGRPVGSMSSRASPDDVPAGRDMRFPARAGRDLQFPARQEDLWTSSSRAEMWRFRSISVCTSRRS